MQKRDLGLIFSLTILFSAVSLGLVSANPAPLFPLPWEPVTTSPTIVVTSPVQNETYDSTELWLNFSVIVNDDNCYENITSVYFTVDGRDQQNITVKDIDTLFYPTARTLNFSLNLSNLSLSSGMHNLTVNLDADSYYVLYVPREGFTLPSVPVHSTSETVIFNVNRQLHIDSLTATVIFTVPIAILAVYSYRKIKTRHKEN
jgi:hypothetical protein